MECDAFKASKRSKIPQGFFEVEKILSHKYQDGKIFYLLQWKGYSEDQSSWQPEDSIGSKILIEQYRQAFKKKSNTPQEIQLPIKLIRQSQLKKKISFKPSQPRKIKILNHFIHNETLFYVVQDGEIVNNFPENYANIHFQQPLLEYASFYMKKEFKERVVSAAYNMNFKTPTERSESSEMEEEFTFGNY